MCVPAPTRCPAALRPASPSRLSMDESHALEAQAMDGHVVLARTGAPAATGFAGAGAAASRAGGRPAAADRRSNLIALY